MITNLYQQSLGYVQFTGVTNAAAIQLGVTAPSNAGAKTAIPQGANSALIYIEAQGVRWRDDNTAPTSSVGMPVAAGQDFLYIGNIPQLQFIGQVSGATVNVTYYA